MSKRGRPSTVVPKLWQLYSHVRGCMLTTTATARLLGLTISQVSKGRQELERAKLIRVTRHAASHGGGRPRLLVTALFDTDALSHFDNLSLDPTSPRSGTQEIRSKEVDASYQNDSDEGLEIEEDSMRINSPLEEIPHDLAPRLVEPRPHEALLRRFSERFEKAYGARYSPRPEDYRHAKNLTRDFEPHLLELMLSGFFAMDMYKARDLNMPPLRRLWWLREELLQDANDALRNREAKHEQFETMTPKERQEYRDAVRRVHEEAEHPPLRGKLRLVGS